jgi:hypothetical protein
VTGAAALALVLVWPPAAQQAQTQDRFYVAGTSASSLADEGLAKLAPGGARAADFQELPAPGVRFVPTVARATSVPWIDTNAHRYRRGLRKANYATLPEGTAALAAAEAFAFGAEAILNPDPADVNELKAMLRFLQSQERPPLPPLVNIGVIDDGTPRMGEVLKMLSRRNLLYRVVAAPDRGLDLNVRIGSREFPSSEAGNPYRFAVLVRDKLGDNKRLVRLYGTNTVLAHLTGDSTRARLFLLQYGRGRRSIPAEAPPAMQVRLLGTYRPVGLAAFSAPAGAKPSDIQHVDGGTEFWLPDFAVCAIIDFEVVK